MNENRISIGSNGYEFVIITYRGHTRALEKMITARSRGSSEEIETKNQKKKNKVPLAIRQSAVDCPILAP
ncbi:hypothetical protein TNCV_225051 [Trichonephila clavipes]|nr:hypothetical protein TNCV_225051 [Trichonephila clavipes]